MTKGGHAPPQEVLMTGRSALLGGAMLIAASGACRPAGAQERPLNIYPAHDVAITYTVIDDQRNTSSVVDMHWRGGGQEARVDLPGGTYAVVDRGSDLASLVLPRQHIVMQIRLSATPVAEFLPDQSAEFTRGGSDTVIGHRCDLWTLRNANGTASVCLTADGVVLRAQGKAKDGEAGGVIATAVNYVPQPQGLFTAPADFPKLDLSQQMSRMLTTPQAPR
jgi:hypothetical protein